MFKAVTVGVIAFMIGGVSVSATKTSNSNYKQKVAKIKAENKKKIKNAKKKQINKNKQAKAAKVNDKQLKKLLTQKRAEQQKIKVISGKERNVHVAVPNTSYPEAPTAKNIVLRTENLPSKLVDPKAPSIPQLDINAYYVYKKTHQDKSSKINSKLTTSQQKEIADYTITLLNSYLVNNGKAPVKWSTQMQTQTIRLSNAREARYSDGYETSQSLIDQPFLPYKGLDYKGELIGSLYTPSHTMLELKVSVLNTLTQMMYMDPIQKYNESLKSNSGRQVGVSVHEADLASGSNAYILLISFAEANGKVKIQNQNTSFTAIYRKNVASTKELRALNASQKKLVKLNKQIKVRNAYLNKVMKKKFNQNAKEFNKAKQQANRVMANKLRQL